MSNYFLKFAEWYEQLEGDSTELDSLNRSLTILNEQGEIVGKANFAQELPSEIKTDELLIPESKQSGLVYFIMLNGYNGKNYLYRREITLIL